MNARQCLASAPAAGLLVATLLAVAGCTAGGGSIYYVLQHETKVIDNTLRNDITFFDVAKVGASYFAAGGSIWSAQDVAAASWGTTSWDTANPVTPPQAGALCNALTAFGGFLFGGFVDAAGNLGLYQSAAAPSFSGQPAIADGAIAGKQIVRLRTENPGTPTLVVITASPSGTPPGSSFTYEVATSADGATFTTAAFTPIRTDASTPILDAIYAGAPFNTWFVTEGTTLSMGPLTALAPVTTLPSTITTSDQLRDLFYDGTSTPPALYVSSKLGAVYYTTDGALSASAWTTASAAKVSGVTPGLWGFAGPIGGAGGAIVVGSDGYGYYTVSGTTLTRFSDSTIRLYSAAIRRFVLDTGTNGRLFACTSDTGLWRGEISGAGAAATIKWYWE